MAAPRYVLIGGSAASAAALKTLLASREDGRVTVLCAEPHPPYTPTSLHHILAGHVREEDIFMVPPPLLADRRLELFLGNPVVALWPEVKTVECADGRSHPYDKLLIAAGARATLPPIPGREHENVLVFRTLEDLHKLQGLVKKGDEVAILGAGLVGMQAAIGLAEMGARVALIEKERRIMPLYFDGPALDSIEKVFREHGARLFTGTTLSGIEGGRDGRLSLTLQDGKRLSAKALIVATGVAPRLEVCRGSGVETELGILVDSAMRTNLPEIYAAGDIAQAPDFFSGRKVLNPILPSAAEQGRVAAMDMLGLPIRYPGSLPQNSFVFFGHTAVSLGEALAEEGDGYEVHRRSEDGRSRYRKLAFKEGRLVGAIFVNERDQQGVAYSLIRERRDLSAHKDEILRFPIDYARALRWGIGEERWRGLGRKV